MSAPSKLVTADEMRAIEAVAFDGGATAAGLMENAGRAIAQAVRTELHEARARRILVLVGPGNNGGDGLVAARYLYESGAEVRVMLLAPRSEDDANLQAVRALTDIEVTELGDVEAEVSGAITRADAIIDAILGIGPRRPLTGLVATVCRRLATRRGLLFAVDVPTGLDADTGEIDPLTPAADATYALGFSKLGLHIYPGSAAAGEVDVLAIGLKAEAGDSIQTELLTDAWARAALPPRPAVSNKGSFGRVLVVAGSESYTGAATLSCMGALRAGAGLVTLAALPSVRAAVASQLPEVIFVPLPVDAEGAPAADAGDVVIRALPGYDALLIGPGLGQASGAQALVRGLLAAPQLADLPVVIDADALNTLAKSPGWAELLPANCILTPHPGEFARLAKSSVAEVQAARPRLARACAAAWGQTLVLKGANTLVVRRDGVAFLSPFASALLATAGTGDVLAGTIAGLLAQDVAPFDAAGLGVYLHAAAAATYEADYGPSGLLASELGAAIAKTAWTLRSS